MNVTVRSCLVISGRLFRLEGNGDREEPRKWKDLSGETVNSVHGQRICSLASRFPVYEFLWPVGFRDMMVPAERAVFTM